MRRTGAPVARPQSVQCGECIRGKSGAGLGGGIRRDIAVGKHRKRRFGKVKAQFLVIMNDREAERRVVCRNAGELRQVLLRQQAVDDLNGDRKVVAERAVPVPDKGIVFPAARPRF